MGAITQLIENAGNIVQRKLDASIYEWMRQISTIADNISGGTQAEVRYVNKGGNDTTGDGSFDNPFLTIQAAMTSITDAASTKPYSVQVAPGVYTDTFLLKPWCYVEGIDKSAVFLNPTTANWIDPAFVAAGAQDTGISNVTLQSNLTVNFATVVSPGAGTFKLRDVLLDSAVALSFTGNNVANVVDLQNLESIGPTSSPLTLANIQSNGSACSMRNGTLTITGTDGYLTNHRLYSFVTGGAINITWTGAVTANSLVVTIGGISVTPATSYTVSGAGAQLLTRQAPIQVAGPDANTTFSFGVIPNGGTVILGQGSDNDIVALPTANRTYSLEAPGVAGTRLRIINQSAFVITLATAGSATFLAGLPTYVGPFQTLELYASTGVLWNAFSVVQAGVTTLTNGVSALVPADITAQSRIVVTWKTTSGAAGVPQVPAGGRVVGTRAGGGGFVIHSVALATGADVATDQGTYEWHVTNG